MAYLHFVPLLSLFRSKETWQCDVDQFLFQKGEALTARVFQIKLVGPKIGFGLDGIPSGPRIPGLMQIVTTRTISMFRSGNQGIPCDDLCICHCYWARGVTSKNG